MLVTLKQTGFTLQVHAEWTTAAINHAISYSRYQPRLKVRFATDIALMMNLCKHARKVLQLSTVSLCFLVWSQSCVRQNVTHRHAEMTADRDGEEKQQISDSGRDGGKTINSTNLLIWGNRRRGRKREREGDWMNELHKEDSFTRLSKDA